MEELKPPFTQCRQTCVLKIDYCVPEDLAGTESADAKTVWLDEAAEAVRLNN